MTTLDTDEIRLLHEVGLLAGARADIKSAHAIFGALELFRPSSCFPYVGLAMAQINRREHRDALVTLDRGLMMIDDEEKRRTLHAYRALALHLSGRIAERDCAIDAAQGHPMAVSLSKEPPPAAKH
jgi:hypothetical protein